MLVIVMDNQLLQPQAVCQGCLMASQEGHPRWHQGRLGCGRRLQAGIGAETETGEQYECQMGFRVAHIP